MEFKEVIKILRNESGLTQDELAQKIGVTRSAVANYETQGKNPEIDTLLKIADIFNVSIDFLLGRSEIRILNNQLSVFSNDNTEIDRLIQKIVSNNRVRELVFYIADMNENDIDKLMRILKIVEEKN